jgi:hypothetical protein
MKIDFIKIVTILVFSFVAFVAGILLCRSCEVYNKNQGNHNETNNKIE